MWMSPSWSPLIHLERAFQYDYTQGQLPELTEVIIRNKAALFVCAVGVPPKWMVDKLHAAGIAVMKYVSPPVP